MFSLWTSDLEKLLYKDAQATPKSIYKHIINLSLDNNGLIMCSLCHYGIQSKNNYEKHANLHSRGSILLQNTVGECTLIKIR